MGALAGKVCMVVGAVSPTGAAIIERFTGEGGRAFATDQDEAGLAELMTRHGHNQVDALRSDIGEETEVVRLFARCVRRFGRLDLLVLVPGRTPPGPPPAELPKRRAGGVQLCLDHASSAMRRHGGGVIAVVQEAPAGLRAGEEAAGGPSADAAIVEVTRGAANDLDALGIRVELIAPDADARPDEVAGRVLSLLVARAPGPTATPDAGG